MGERTKHSELTNSYTVSNRINKIKFLNNGY